MGVAACVVSLLLAVAGLIAKFTAGVANPTYGDPGLTVHIIQDDADSEPPVESVDRPDSPEPRESTSVTETAIIPEDVPPATPIAVQSNERPKVDWQGMIAESVTSMAEESQVREETRALAWGRSRSVMFQPEEGYIPKHEVPAIPGFRFKPQVRVAGLGVTIGSCFIGIPIVGVPVEERTVAITVFVCASD